MLALFALAAVAAAAIPDYARTYAPLVHHHSQEKYFPSSIEAQVNHSIPEINYAPVAGTWTLDNLNDLGSNVYLTSKEGIQALPDWFKGLPGKNGAIIPVNKGDYVDVFYFFFYAYNQGNTVVGLEFGDHVGDWEHVMIRFQNGKPKSVWLSQHSLGQAFTYDALEKDGVRPVVYMGKGTHAAWPTTGDHDHTIPGLDFPGGLIVDQTDKGPIFEFDYYELDYNNLPPWIQYRGAWGDQEVPGQKKIFGQQKYSSGPTGPLDKRLNRKQVCNVDDNQLCVVWPFLL